MITLNTYKTNNEFRPYKEAKLTIAILDKKIEAIKNKISIGLKLNSDPKTNAS